ncbi:MAG: TerC family protein [Candidatus Kapabacteria bacterium]|nr:TerC family protein [Candidatus Kapabacteria bacterium]
MEYLFTSEAIVSLLTLSLLEIVLGIDNIIFMSILVVRLPKERQEFARRLGLALALIFRIGLLFSISWLANLTQPFINIASFGFSGRDLIMLGGGLFLIAKSTTEIHNKMEGAEEGQTNVKSVSLSGILTQIIILDLVFSLDSVITAVGLSQHLEIMIAANVIAMVIMLFSAKSISNFVHQHPTVKMLALAFLLMVGFVLFLDGFHVHVEKGYIYTAMAFSLTVELLNMRFRRKQMKPVALHNSPELPNA